MASTGPKKSPHLSSEESSSSSSEGTDSTPNTPPSPNIEVFVPPPAPVTPPRTPQNSRHSASGYKHSPRSTPIKSRLGIIDEHSDAVSPDVPLRSPLRRLGLSPIKFSLDSIPTLHAKKDSPKNIYDDVKGPKGEKFSDLRDNKKGDRPRRCGWRTLVLIACVLLIIIAAVLIGVIVGLKVRNDNRNKNQETSPSGNSTFTGKNDYPAGNYSIASYLTDIDTSCTTNSATWGCYPQITYSQSPAGSLSTLSWTITASKDGQFVITSADRVFSYTFQNLPLSKVNDGTSDEYWHFNTTFDKPVFPSRQITSDGAAAICYFNNTSLDGRLYTQKPRAQALQNATASLGSNSGVFQPWPYALSFTETRGNGPGVPNCFTWINAQAGSRINITEVTTSAGQVASCQCNYANFV